VQVNQEQIASDPDLLRQWIHHRRAELVFHHWALGPDPQQFLLHPPDPKAVTERLHSLTAHTVALGVLVAGEGEALAERMSRTWVRLAEGLLPHYVTSPADAELDAIWGEHIETLGDLAFLALAWRPDPRRPDLVEELLEFLRSEMAFLDGARLGAATNALEGPSGYAVRLLANWAAGLFQLERLPDVLEPAWKERIAGRLSSDLLVRMAFTTYQDRTGNRDAADRALVFLDRARCLAPDDPSIELYACDFLMLGRYYDEAREAASAFYKKHGKRDAEDAARVEEWVRILKEEAREGRKGERRAAAIVAEDTAEAPSDELAAREQEIERFPSSIATYEELVRIHAAHWRFAEATAWAERAIASCLGRDGQLRARALLLEVRGLEDLAQHDSEAPRLYLAGAFAQVQESLEARFPAHDEPFTIAYLRGHCLLALGRPDEALESFQRAQATCDRGLLRTVLRGLAADIDLPYLAKVRRRIQELTDARDLSGALTAAAAMLKGL
jgi:tetratricopeptide (TPR) repeat protein